MLALGRHLRRHTLRSDAIPLVKRAGQRRNTPPQRNLTSTHASQSKSQRGGGRLYVAVPAALLTVGALGYVTYENYQPFRHTVLAVVRCSRVAGTHA